MRRLKTKLIELMAQWQVDNRALLTQSTLAREIEVSPATVNRWVHGDLERIEVDVLIKLCDYFGCTVADIIEILPDKEKA